MSLNSTPSANRIHIGFFGCRNAGKSSVVNAVTGQNLSIVSEVKGTTTDPVSKAMELLPMGPVVVIDTPGLDDEGVVGELRIQKAKQVLNKTDIAVLVVDSTVGKNRLDEELTMVFAAKKLPYIVVYNKADLSEPQNLQENEISVSALTNEGIIELKEKIAALAGNIKGDKRVIGDLLNPEDVVILVTPIDESAPKGRMILPQVQTIRDILDSHAIVVTTQVEQLETALDMLKNPPRMVVTDSQAFGKVKQIVPPGIFLTSFSILLARFKGVLETAVEGAVSLEKLRDGDTVLISEGCTHHRQCNDIGTVKMPDWIRKHTGKKINFAFTSGTEFKEDLSEYKLIVHCGGCMLNEKEMQYRQQYAEELHIPYTNYGIIIAYMNGILARSVEVFPEIYEKLIK
ncbi:MAG: [FeFe] hydrogenase H-cluster maturation GTPase HydF [Bacillota bacterium]|jgi:[FeFe] hydrogenase H-cluster maturation GTPase HydF